MNNHLLLLLCLFLSTNILFGQPQTADEKIALIKKEEDKIKAFSSECEMSNAYVDALEDYLEELEHEFPNGQIPDDMIDEIKSRFVKQFCRKQYFIDNPISWNIYKGVHRSPEEFCDHGGFDTGFSTLLDGLSVSDGFISQCEDTGIDAPLDITATNHIEVITGGSDPYLPGMSFAGAPFIKLNFVENSILDHQSIKYSRAFVLDAPQQIVYFDFAVAMYFSSFHVLPDNPFFMMRAVRVSDGAVFGEQCIAADPADPRLTSTATLPTGEVLSTNGWDCNFFNLSGSPGDSFYLEFIITDCLTGGHFGYAYIDNIYAESCDDVVVCGEPSTGNVSFTDPTTALCIDDFPRQVCGQYIAPTDITGTPFNASTFSLIIKDLSGNPVTVGSIPLASHDPATGDFCFNVNTSHFPSPPTAYEFEVEIEFTLGGFSQTVSTISTAPGPDVSACMVDCSCVDNASWDYTIAGCNVTFEANAGASGCNLIFNWDFDGNPGTIEATGTNPSWTFDGVGPHCVLLIVIDADNNCTSQSFEDCITLPGCNMTDCSCLTDASFTFDTDGCSATFTAMPGDPSCTNLTYAWDFTGDGGTDASGLVVTWPSFDGPGPHPVTLTVIDDSGNCDSETISDLIPLPDCTDCDCLTNASFNYSIDECTAFFNAVPGDPSCTNLSYTWDFTGDGSPDASGISAVWSDFDGPGPHPVVLTISDDLGNCDSETINDSVELPDCVDCDCVADASFTLEAVGCDISATFMPGGPGCDLLFQWYLNGTPAGTGMNPVMNASGPGPHTVELHLTEATGQCDENIITQTISTPDCFDCDCVAEADFEFTINGCDVTFTSLPGGGDCDGLVYSWDFDNDGVEDSNEMNPSHTFDGPGPHIVTLTIVDAANDCEEKIIIKDILLPECPDCTCTAAASFNYTSNQCDITFNAIPGPGDCDLSYDWDFGDGNTGTGQNPVHTYDGPGPYTVTLTVSTPDCEDIITMSVSAPNCCSAGGTSLIIIRSSFESACVDNNPCKPRDKKCDPGTIDDECFQACEGSTVTYYIEDPEPGSTFVWEVLGGIFTIIDGSSISVEWPFIPPGSTSLDGLITVTETTTGGCETTASRCVEITESPVAGFSAEPDIACIDQNIQFINESIGEELSYLWIFGDGNTSIEESPNHSYESSAIYEVLLIAVNNCGCADTFALDVKVNDEDAHLIECVGTVCAGDVASYNLVFGSNECNVINSDILWEVSGGDIVSGQGTEEVTIQWSDNPVGQVSVTVTGCGCATTITETVPILSNSLTLTGPDVVCVGEQVAFFTECQPGRTFDWTIVGGAIVSQNQMLNEVVVEYNTFGTFSISVEVGDNEVLNCLGDEPITLTQSVTVVPEGVIQPEETSFCAEDLSDETFSVVVNDVPTTSIYFWSLINSDGVSVSTSFGNTFSVPAGLILAPGDYTIQAAITSNDPPVLCNAVITHFITIQPKPAVPEYLGGAAQACPGETYTYTANPDANHLIYWEVVGGTVNGQPNATGDEVAVTWGATPPFELYVHQYNPQAGSCLSDPVVVTIETIDAANYGVFFGSIADPAPLPGPTNVCVGDHFFHTDATALVYEWSVEPAYLGSVISGQFTNDVEIAFHYDESVTPPYDGVIVRLTANICGEEEIYEYIIDVEKPTVELNGPTEACVGSANTFTANLLPAGVMAEYVWYVDESPIASGASPTLDYTFDVDGVHSVVVEVMITDPGFACSGSVFSAATSVNVSYPFGINIIGYIYPESCQSEFTVEAPASPGGPYNYTWYNDGVPFFTDNGVVTSTYTFNSGSFPLGVVTIEVIDPEHPECVITERVPGKGCDGGPGGSSTCTGHSVFSQLSRSCDDLTATFELIVVPGETFDHFIFGDGTSTSTYSEILSHTYATPDYYTAELWIMENGILCRSHTLIVDARFPEPTFAVPSQVCELTPVSINNTSDLTNIVDIVWDFGDESNSNEVSPVKTYQDVSGVEVYPISLTITDQYGCQNTISQSITVNDNALLDNLEILPNVPTGACGSILLSADANSTPPYNYNWFSGVDPTTSIGSSINQVITESGQYIVEVGDAFGCIARANSAFMSVYPEPVPLFSGATQYCVEDSIKLEALSGDQFTYQWTSSWGVSSSQSNFTTIAPLSGVHTVTLTVTNETPVGDCTASTVLSISVHEAPYVQILQPYACAPELVEVFDPNPDYEYFWSNGTQGTSTTAVVGSVIQVTAINEVGCTGTDFIAVSEGIDFCNMMTGCYEVCPGLWPAPPGYAFYQWYEMNGDGDFIPIPAPTGTDSLLNLSAVGEGSYQVMVTDAFGCSGISDVVEIIFDLSACAPTGQVCALKVEDPSLNLEQVQCIGEFGGYHYYDVFIPYDNIPGNTAQVLYFLSDHSGDLISLSSSNYIAAGSSGFIHMVIGVEDVSSRGIVLHYLDATGKQCRVDFKVHFPEKCKELKECEKMELKDKPTGQCIDALPGISVYEVTALISYSQGPFYDVEGISLNPGINVLSATFTDIEPGLMAVTLQFHVSSFSQFQKICFNLIFDANPKGTKKCVFDFCISSFDHDCGRRLAREADQSGSSVSQWVIYPNPSSGLFYIENGLGQSVALTHIEAINAQGQVIKTLSQDEMGLERSVLDLSDYADGLYWVRITDAQGQAITKRIIKVK